MDIDAIKERCDKATPGPWRYNRVSRNVYEYLTNVDVIVGRLNGTGNADNNGLFIANARHDILALIAEIETLRVQLAESQRSEMAAVEDITHCCGTCKHYRPEMLEHEQCAISTACHWEWRGPVGEGEHEH